MSCGVDASTGLRKIVVAFGDTFGVVSAGYGGVLGCERGASDCDSLCDNTACCENVC